MERRIVPFSQGTSEFIDRKSRFLGFAMEVDSEEAAKSVIGEFRSKYWDATHCVYAYQIGDNGEIQRSNDDGEPAGTSGRPVLEAIIASGLTNTLVVVIRYFGGTLLGTGGLVRAYGKTASDALISCGRAEYKKAVEACLLFDYDVLGKVQNFLAGKNYVVVTDTVYQNNVAMNLDILCDCMTEFRASLKNFFGEKVILTIFQKEKWLKMTGNIFTKNDE